MGLIHGETGGRNRADGCGAAELEGLENRRRIVRGLARRARIVLAAAAGTENQVIAQTIGGDATLSGNGAEALPSIAWMGFITTRAAARHSGLATRKSPRRSA